MYNVTIPSLKTIERNAGHEVKVYSDIILYEAQTNDYIHTAVKVKIYLSEHLLRARTITTPYFFLYILIPYLMIKIFL